MLCYGLVHARTVIYSVTFNVLYHTAYDTIIFYIQIKNIMTTIK